ISGKLESIDRTTGTMVLSFVVAEPTFLTQKNLEAYLRDPEQPGTPARVKLRCAPTKDHPNGRELTLRWGDRPYLEGWATSPSLPLDIHSWSASADWQEGRIPLDKWLSLIVRVEFSPSQQTEPLIPCRGSLLHR